MEKRDEVIERVRAKLLERSSGIITIDLKSKQLSIDNYYNVIESIPSGIKTFK